MFEQREIEINIPQPPENITPIHILVLGYGIEKYGRLRHLRDQTKNFLRREKTRAQQEAVKEEYYGRLSRSIRRIR